MHELSYSLLNLQITSKPIVLKLKRAFNTAHSSSSTRTNFFIRVSCNSDKHTSNQKIQTINGYGQCGLPPKKPFCYLSDADDCKQFMRQLLQRFQKEVKVEMQKYKQQKDQLNEIVINLYKDVFEGIQSENYFALLWQKVKIYSSQQTQTQSQNSLTNFDHQVVLYQVFNLFKIAKELHLKNYQYSACRSALQFSLFDFIGKFYHISVADLICNKKHEQITNYSFYTISHEKNLEDMIKNGKQSLIFTSCIKIKFNNQIKQLIKLIIELDRQQIGNKWIIDANASWNPEDYLLFEKEFYHLIQQSPNSMLKQKILFVQQPFPIFQALQENEDEIIKIKNKWSKIRQSTKFKIIADQSFVNINNLSQMISYCHGINIKMQKCGGPIEAVKILNQFPKFEQYQQLMFGSMVSTHLGCTQTFQFYKFANYFDIDGALLTAQPQINGGFGWHGEKGIQKISGDGLAIQESDIERLFN